MTTLFRHPWTRWPAWLALGALVFGGASTLRAAAKDVKPAYEAAPVLQAADVLPAPLLAGRYHTVAYLVPTTGYFYHFELKSSYGRYNVVSRELLEVRIHEAGILARAVELKDKYEFLRAAGGRIKATGEALVNTVVHPVQTVKAVGRGVGEKVIAIGRLFKGRKRSKRRDSFVKELLIAKNKRRVAYEIKVDVYSTNPQIQDLLDSIASQRAAGQVAVNLGAILIPGAAGLVVSVGKFNASMRATIRDKSPGELADLNDEKLERIGVQPPLRKLFINHREYSPSHQTFLVGALEQMRGVRNRGAFIQAALHATDEASALAYQKTAERLAYYHLNEARIQRLEAAGGMPVAFTTDGTLIAASPFDYGFWDAETDRALKAIGKIKHPPATRRRELVTAGRLSPRARQGYRAWGYATKEGYRVSL